MTIINSASWSAAEIDKYCYLSGEAKNFSVAAIAEYLNNNVPYASYLAEREKWVEAQSNSRANSEAAETLPLSFPEIADGAAAFSLESFNNTAIILTAGGEGERLRKSLIAAGASPDELKDFTKATWPLDGQTKAASTLGYNLLFFRAIGRALGQKLLIIVTTGPLGSDTARILPAYLETFQDEYLDIITLPQGQRFHLTTGGQLVLSAAGPHLSVACNPDETGGPFMALKNPHERDAKGLIHYLLAKGLINCLALQATTICQPLWVSSLPAALKKAEVAVMGVRRDTFAPDDPFGTIVRFNAAGGDYTQIVEAHNRRPAIYSVRDEKYGFLPYNSGMYAFKTELLATARLPDFICPPKMITPELPPAGKVGYAATDLLSLSPKVAVCLTKADSFAAFKGLADTQNLIAAATKLLEFLPHIY